MAKVSIPSNAKASEIMVQLLEWAQANNGWKAPNSMLDCFGILAKKVNEEYEKAKDRLK